MFGRSSGVPPRRIGHKPDFGGMSDRVSYSTSIHPTRGLNAPEAVADLKRFTVQRLMIATPRSALILGGVNPRPTKSSEGA
jgi:hypothetical protein